MKMKITKNIQIAWQNGRIGVALMVIGIIAAIAPSPGFRMGGQKRSPR
ncbi:MAG TPA: hypothetical protein VLE93_01230 [Candidatus Saccharimonadales bacterium]|nr:hypothetical protein [Candidatus Saccharimonadales bacterium]